MMVDAVGGTGHIDFTEAMEPRATNGDTMTVYRNADDTRRYVVHHRLGGEWDVDVWVSRFECRTYSADAGDAFPTKADARRWAASDAGSALVSLPASTHPEVTSRWTR